MSDMFDWITPEEQEQAIDYVRRHPAEFGWTSENEIEIAGFLLVLEKYGLVARKYQRCPFTGRMTPMWKRIDPKHQTHG